jgi:hypothetical protein
MIKQRPSQKLRNTHSELLLAVKDFGRDCQERDVPFIKQREKDLNFSIQLAIVQRLDALLEMAEHRVVDHICKVEGHDKINQNNKKKQEDLLKPPGTEGRDEDDVDDFLRGLNGGTAE